MQKEKSDVHLMTYLCVSRIILIQLRLLCIVNLIFEKTPFPLVHSLSFVSRLTRSSQVLINMYRKRTAHEISELHLI